MQIGVLTAKLTLDSADFVSGTEDAKKSAKGLGEAISGLNFRQIGAEIAGVGAVLTGVFGTGLALAVKAASDLNESLTKSQVVFGESAKAIQGWAATAATSMGLSTQAAIESAATFGNLFTAMGVTGPAAASMSQNLVQLASDLASFNNQSPEEMLLKLRSGLVGEIEPLRAVGVQMNEATVQAKAMEMGLGKTKAQISEADKVLARYAIILEQTKNAQGDFGRTSDGVANQMRIMKARTDDLLASFGGGLLPAVSGSLKIFNDLLGFLTQLPDQFKNVAVAVVGVTAAVGASMVVIGGLVALLGGPLTLTIIAVVGTIAALTAAVALEWDRIAQIFQGGTVNVRITMKQLAGILGATADAFAILARVASMQLDAIVTAAKIMVIGVSAAFTALKVSLASALAGLASGDVRAFAVGLMNIGSLTQETFSKMASASGAFTGRIKQDVEDIQNHFTGKFKGAFEKAADGVSTSVEKMGMSLKDLADNLSKTGKAATAHGKAHEDAAAKASKAWTIAQQVMAQDLAKIAESHQKTMDMVLASKQKADEAWIKQNSVWAMESLKEMENWDKQVAARWKDIEDATALSAKELVKTTEDMTREMTRQHEHYLRVLEELDSQVPKTWANITSAIAQATGGSALHIKQWAADIFGVIDTMPGHFGDVARKVLKTVDTWMQFANRILSILNKLDSDIPSSIGGAISGLIGIFKGGATAATGSTSAIKTAVESIGGTVTKTAATAAQGMGSIGASAGSAAAKVGSAAGGIASAMGIVTGAVQAAQGVFSLFQQSFHSSSKADRGVGGFLLGGPIGAILSIFKGGPTKEQLEQQQRDRDKFKAELEQTQAQTQSIVMDTLGKAMEVFKHLGDHVDVPRAAIKSFFKTLDKVVKEFMSLAVQFAQDNLTAAKQFAENMGPAVDLMGRALETFDKLRFYTAIPAKAIEAMAADIGRAAEAMGTIAADIEQRVVKRARRFSEGMMSVVDLIGSSIEAFIKLQDYKSVPVYVMGWLMQDIQTATDMMGEIADNTSRNMLNKAKTYAERISVIVQSIGAAVVALTSLKTYEAVPQAAFDALQHDVITALSMIDNLVGAAEMYLDRALTFEELVKRIVGALDSGVSLIRSVGGSALSPGGIGLPDGSLRLGGGASSTSTSSVDQSVHIGAVTLSPGQSGYREARQWADVQRIQRAR